MTGRPSYEDRRRRATRPDLWPVFIPPPDVPPLPRRQPDPGGPMEGIERFVDGVLDRMSSGPSAGQYALVR